MREDLVHVIHNGIDTSRFDPQKAAPVLRPLLGLNAGQPLVGMIANFDPRKGHHLFVEACSLVRKKVPCARFIIVGAKEPTPSYALHVQQLIRERGLQDVMFLLGQRSDIPDVLASLNVVVQPSLTEAGPRVPLEAMAMEKPLVVTDVGGNREEVIHGVTGLVVPAGGVRQQAEAVLRLLADENLSKVLGKNGRQIVLERYTEQAHAEKVQRLYDQIVNSAHCAPRLR
jgi:glycosyltransferase involved in cell wall biosynthesis